MGAEWGRVEPSQGESRREEVGAASVKVGRGGNPRGCGRCGGRGRGREGAPGPCDPKPWRVRAGDHLGHLVLRDTTQAREQLQVLTTSQQVENGIRLRAVAHAAVCSGWFPGHTGNGHRCLGNWPPSGETGPRAHPTHPPTICGNRPQGPPPGHPPTLPQTTLLGTGVSQGRAHVQELRSSSTCCRGTVPTWSPLTCGLPAPPRPHWAACPRSPYEMWMSSLLRSRPAARNTGGTGYRVQGTPTDNTQQGFRSLSQCLLPGTGF